MSRVFIADRAWESIGFFTNEFEAGFMLERNAGIFKGEERIFLMILAPTRQIFIRRRDQGRIATQSLSGSEGERDE